MSVKFFTVLLVLFSLLESVKAETIITTVFNVIEKGDKILILSGIDGRVYKAPKINKDSEKFYKRLTGAVVSLEFEIKKDDAFITNITELDPAVVDSRTLDHNRFMYNHLRQVAPTELQSTDEAKEIFKKMYDGDKGWSQCYNRAHMWSYELWTKHKIESQKIFIFYTKRYYMIEDFKWWFHVAPMIIAEGKELVMDKTFMNEPTEVKAWTNHFLKTDKITCPEVDSYPDYEKSHWNKLCVVMKVPMYYYDPLDIEARDKEGKQKNQWVLEELQRARKAFKDGDKIYEGLDTGKSLLDKINIFDRMPL